ncbi:MAG: outer membrane beta-barrel protein [Hyphomicrobiaceae bacterium]|nr:outer membrane beta-barrel protein [Hyphomicrobiaceae bacterium]
MASSSRVHRAIVIVASAGLSCLAGGSVAAQAGPPIWTGAHFGVHGGGAWGETGEDETIELSGGLGGVNGGYLWQSGRFVFGLEGEASFGSIDGDVTESESVSFFGIPVVDLHVRTDVAARNLYALKGKIGYDAGPLLLYATGGVAWTDVEVDALLTVRFLGLPPLAAGANGSETMTGWTLGGGAAYRVLSNVSASVDVSHYRFEDELTLESGGASDTIDVDLHMTVVRGGLTYHLN